MKQKKDKESTKRTGTLNRTALYCCVAMGLCFALTGPTVCVNCCLVIRDDDDEGDSGDYEGFDLRSCQSSMEEVVARLKTNFQVHTPERW